MPLRVVRLPLVATCLLLAAAASAGATTVATRGPDPRGVVATKRDGVRLIGDLRVGPARAPGAVSTLAAVRDVWGRERSLRRCVAGWGTGVRLLFTSFGGPSSCSERFLQVAYVTGPAWTVRIGRASYAIGMSKARLPADARRIDGWNGGGYELATMPFIGSRTTTVMAHVNRRDRVDRFVLFIGRAGD